MCIVMFFFFEIGSFSILLSISIQMTVNSIGKQGLAIGNSLVEREIEYGKNKICTKKLWFSIKVVVVST